MKITKSLSSGLCWTILILLKYMFWYSGFITGDWKREGIFSPHTLSQLKGRNDGKISSTGVLDHVDVWIKHRTKEKISYQRAVKAKMWISKKMLNLGLDIAVKASQCNLLLALWLSITNLLSFHFFIRKMELIHLPCCVIERIRYHICLVLNTVPDPEQPLSKL